MQWSRGPVLTFIVGGISGRHVACGCSLIGWLIFPPDPRLNHSTVGHVLIAWCTATWTCIHSGRRRLTPLQNDCSPHLWWFFSPQSQANKAILYWSGYATVATQHPAVVALPWTGEHRRQVTICFCSIMLGKSCTEGERLSTGVNSLDIVLFYL